MAGNPALQQQALEGWWNASKHPTLHLGWFGIPAYLVPVTISLLLPVLHQLQRKLLESRGSATIDLLNRHKKATDAKTKEIARDLESSGQVAADEGSSSKIVRVCTHILPLYYSSFVLAHSTTILLAKRMEHMTTTSFCIAQGIILVMPSLFDTVDLKTSILVTAGWYGLALQNPPNIPSAVILAVLALPFSIRHWGQLNPAFWPVGCLLFTIAGDAIIPSTSSIRSFKAGGGEIWRLGVFFVPGLIRTFWDMFYSGYQHALESQGGSPAFCERVRTMARAGGQDLIDGVGLALAGLAPVGTCYVISSFSFSCLGWWWVLFGRLAQPVSIMGGFPGGMVFIFLWIILACAGFHPKVDDRPPRPGVAFKNEMVFSAFVAAWTVAGFTALWLGLLGWSWVMDYPAPVV